MEPVETAEIGGGPTSIILFTLIALLMATDLTIEYRRGVSLALQTFELLIFVSALAGIAFHWWVMVSERRRSHQLHRELAEARAEVRRWTEDARRWNAEAQTILQGLGEAIDRQFERWGLTPAEREIALLQLKGLATETSPSCARPASARSASRLLRSIENPASMAAAIWPLSSWKTSSCPPVRRLTYGHPAVER